VETLFYTIAFPPLSARRHREAAVVSGIRVDRIKFVVFIISGVMAAISGTSTQTNSGMG
jgi:ribose transport system permease protein